MRDLHLTGEFPELVEFLRKEGRSLILVVDGVNEHPNAPVLLQHLCSFTTRYAETKAVKVIMSFRSAFFQKTLQALLASGGEESALFPYQVFQTQMVEKEGRKVETYRFALERVDEDELKVIYEAYRDYEGYLDPATGELVRFRPRTPFATLSKSVRSVLTHPWYLLQRQDLRAHP